MSFRDNHAFLFLAKYVNHRNHCEFQPVSHLDTPFLSTVIKRNVIVCQWFKMYIHTHQIGNYAQCILLYIFLYHWLIYLFLCMWPPFSDGKYHEQIRIAEDSTGYSYGALFKPYISSLLTEVWVEDPYIRHIHQVKMSISLIHATTEILIKRCCKFLTTFTLYFSCTTLCGSARCCWNLPAKWKRSTFWPHRMTWGFFLLLSLLLPCAVA